LDRIGGNKRKETLMFNKPFDGQWMEMPDSLGGLATMMLL
jgi:hypothetical protein